MLHVFLFFWISLWTRLCSVDPSVDPSAHLPGEKYSQPGPRGLGQPYFQTKLNHEIATSLAHEDLANCNFDPLSFPSPPSPPMQFNPSESTVSLAHVDLANSIFRQS